MLKSVFRKIANNFWLFFCLILGSLLITSILAAIPIYTDGALRKMLNVELDQFATRNNEYVSPGELYAELTFRGEYSPDGIASVIADTDRVIENTFRNNDVKLNASYKRAAIDKLQSYENANINQSYPYSLQYISGIEDHIQLLQGRMCENTTPDGVIEVIVSSVEYNSNYFQLDHVYTMLQGYYSEDTIPNTIQVKVVGVYEPNYADVHYWRKTDIDSEMQATFITSEAAFDTYFLQSGRAGYLSSASWFYNVDLYGLQKNELEPYLNVNEQIRSYFKTLYDGTWKFSVPINPVLSEYLKKSDTMEMTMWILNAPVLMML